MNEFLGSLSNEVRQVMEFEVHGGGQFLGELLCVRSVGNLQYGPTVCSTPVLCDDRGVHFRCTVWLKNLMQGKQY